MKNILSILLRRSLHYNCRRNGGMKTGAKIWKTLRCNCSCGHRLNDANDCSNDVNVNANGFRRHLCPY